MIYVTNACYSDSMALTELDKAQLKHAIACREGTAKTLCVRYRLTRDELAEFFDEHETEIRDMRSREESPTSTEPTPTELSQLWIASKIERLWRLQQIAEGIHGEITRYKIFGDAVLIREFRSYLQLAANELGQLLHRGSGDSASGDTLSVSLPGVDIDALR